MTNISIITPVRNSAHTIADTLNSIQKQTVACEHIIIDGASTDATTKIINEHSNPNTLLVTEPDSGRYEAINKGIDLAGGEIIGILNADDFYAGNNVLAKVNEAFEKPEIEACYGDLYYVDRINTEKIIRIWKSGDYKPQNFLAGWMPPHPTFFVRKTLYEKFGNYRRDLGTAADYEVMLRLLLKHEAKTAYIPQVLVHMRNCGDSNASLANRLRANRFDRQAWRVNGLKPKPWTLIAKPLRKIGQWFKPG